MNRWLRIVLGVGAGVLILLLLALTGLAVFFDPNAYKPQIDAAIQREIGREVTIDGPIRLSVFPWLGVELGHVTVANAPGFGRHPIAELDNANASIRLLPLLADRIRVGTVSLNGLRLRLARQADGRTNWQGVVDNLIHRGRQTSTQSSSAPQARAKTAQSEGLPLSSLQIGAIKINQAEVDWDDAATNTHYQFKKLDLDTGRLTDGKPFRLEFSGDLLLPRDKVTAHINVVSSIEPHLADRFYRFASLGVNVLVSGAAIPGGEQEANISAAGEVDLNAGRFSLDNVTFQSAGATLNGKVSGEGLNSQLNYNGRVTITPFSPRSAMQQLEVGPPRTQDSSALTSASFDAQFEGGAKSVRFKQVNASLDDSTLTGTARIDDFRHPRFVFDLNLDQLDIDDYLPPGSAEQAQTSQPPRTGGGDRQKEAEFDLSLLRGVDLSGHVGIGMLTAANVHVGNASMDMKIHNGRLDIAPLTADLYGGRLDLTGLVDASADTPRFALAGTLTHIDVQPLLNDLAQRERLSARSDASMNLHASGRQVAQLKRSVTGRLNFSLADGRFHGVSLHKLLEAAAGRVGASDSTTPAVAPSETTAFSRFAGSFNIRHGLVRGDDLTLITPRITGHGAGRYSIPRNNLDYTIRCDVPDDAGGALGRLAGRSVPLRLDGPLLAPNYDVDTKEALQAADTQHKTRDNAVERRVDGKSTKQAQ